MGQIQKYMKNQGCQQKQGRSALTMPIRRKIRHLKNQPVDRLITGAKSRNMQIGKKYQIWLRKYHRLRDSNFGRNRKSYKPTFDVLESNFWPRVSQAVLKVWKLLFFLPLCSQLIWILFQIDSIILKWFNWFKCWFK